MSTPEGTSHWNNAMSISPGGGSNSDSRNRVRESRNALLAAAATAASVGGDDPITMHHHYRRPRSNSIPIHHPSTASPSSSSSRNRSLLETAVEALAHSPDATSIMDTNSLTMRRAAKELMGIQQMRSRWSIVDPRTSEDHNSSSDSGGGSGEYWTQEDDNDNNDEMEYTDDPNGFQDEEQQQQQQGEQETTSLLSAALKQSKNITSSGGSSNSYGSTALIEEGLVTADHSTSATNTNTTTIDNGPKKQLPVIPTLDPNDDGHHHLYHRQQHHHSDRKKSKTTSMTSSRNKTIENIIQQISSVAVVALLNIMIAIPFGASYFPVGWRAAEGGSTNNNNSDEAGLVDDINGDFPLQGKQALGIRMFLFATLMGQLAFTFASKFQNPVGLQMVENVPFLHALCHTVIQQQGYGINALSTVFFLFGLSSVMVGLVFYALGKLELGRIVYFFPNHVLVGCIGGIGVFIIITSVEVTNDVTFTFDANGMQAFVDNFHLFSIVLLFEIVLRLLSWATQDKQGRPKYPLLSPVYYCLITPIFYLGLLVFGISMERATEIGYFFPSSTSGGDSHTASSSSSSSIWSDPTLWDMFSVIDLSTISWTAVFHSTGTVIALAAFSLIHVPINIPAFAISTDADTDMNSELIAHGYANALSGMFGGLQTYMSYSNSVLYAKSGGKGTISSLAIVACTGILFVIGPEIASYLPRCMAGTLLLHIGIDLILEGVYDSYGNYDIIEYAGIWVIVLVMTIWGMSAALIAGVIAALSTYAMQSINYHNPIRQIMTASTLRSSAWARCSASRKILESPIHGRARILIFQLQGHLFFGNVAQLSDTIREVLKEKKDEGMSPLVVIVDFTLVIGMDSSAAHAVAKLKKIIHRLFHVELSIFVTGSGRGGFPCEFALSDALSPADEKTIQHAAVDWNDVPAADADLLKSPKSVKRGTISVSPGTPSLQAGAKLTQNIDGTVCESLDDALKFAEDILIARENPLLQGSAGMSDLKEYTSINMTLQEEKYFAKKFMKELFQSVPDLEAHIDILLNHMVREEYTKNQTLWEEGDESDSLKLLICGELISVIEDTGASEIVERGNIMGELGLVQGSNRLTTLICASEKAVLYSLSRHTWDRLQQDYPIISSLIDRLTIRYLAHRVQHVNNRYFHTTLPV